MKKQKREDLKKQQELRRRITEIKIPLQARIQTLDMAEKDLVRDVDITITNLFAEIVRLEDEVKRLIEENEKLKKGKEKKK